MALISNSVEYYKNLYRIQDENAPLPMAQFSYDSSMACSVDLDTRYITMPKSLNLGVALDHEAKIVYFVVDRYYDNQDLLDTTCVIQYENAKGDAYTYPVPFYDPYTEKANNKIVIPWVISRNVTVTSGTVKFSLKFYIIDNESRELVYNIGTMTSSAKVLDTMDLSEEIADDYEITHTILEEIEDRLSDYARQTDITWLDLSSTSNDITSFKINDEDAQYVLATGLRDYGQVYYRTTNGRDYYPVNFNNTDATYGKVQSTDVLAQPYTTYYYYGKLQEDGGYDNKYYLIDNITVGSTLSHEGYYDIYKQINNYLKVGEKVTTDFLEIGEDAVSVTLTNSLGLLMNVYLYTTNTTGATVVESYSGVRSGSEVVIPKNQSIKYMKICINTSIAPGTIRGTYIIAK